MSGSRGSRWWVVVSLLSLAPSVGLAQMQANGWKILACTIETPTDFRGTPWTVWFSEAGKVFFGGSEHKASVSPADISFEIKKERGDARYTISRITGRFSAVLNPSGTLGLVTGSCVLADKPKF